MQRVSTSHFICISPTSTLRIQWVDNTVLDSADQQSTQWMNETARQSPWNNIAAVGIGRERYGEGVNGGMGDRGSAAGTWGSKSE